MLNPFKIEIAENKEMKAWDLRLQTGNFKTRKSVEAAAKALAEFLEGHEGWFESQQ